MGVKVIAKKYGLMSSRKRKSIFKKFTKKQRSMASSVAIPEATYDTDYYEINIPAEEEDFRLVLDENRGTPTDNYTLTTNYWHRHRIANYSFNNIKNAEDVQKALEQVFRNSTRAFRFTIYFDSIWEEELPDRESSFIRRRKQYRYFSSRNSNNRNPFNFISPGHDVPTERMVSIRNMDELNFYKEQLNHERIKEYMTTDRGSSVRPICIYRVIFKVLRLNTPLGSITKLPDFIENSRHIISLKNVDDGDCFWACMALGYGCTQDRWKERGRELKQTWYDYTNYNRNYIGMTIEDIIEYEAKVNTDFAIIIINITDINKNDGIVYDNIYLSPFRNDKTRTRIYLNVFNDHLSFVRNLEHKINIRMCEACGKNFRDSYNMKRHLESGCGKIKKNKYVKPSNSIFKKEENIIYSLCRLYGVNTFKFTETGKQDLGLHERSHELTENIENLYKYDYIITYDFEAMLAHIKEEDERLKHIGDISTKTCNIENCNNKAVKILWNTVNKSKYIRLCKEHENYKDSTHKECETFYTTEHIPTCVAFASNIPSYEKCYIYDDDPVSLVQRMFEYIDKATEVAGNLMQEKLDALIEILTDFNDKKNLEKVIDYCTCVPILGFNNAKYDNNLIKKHGFIFEILKRCREAIYY